MKRKWLKTTVMMLAALLAFPLLSKADGLADNIHGLQGTLDNVYDEMLPMCSDLIGTGRAIAGFGALCYIGFRVWRHIANAEPVEVFPLLRPFALGMAILLFPVVISVMNGVMKPTVTATEKMVKNSDAAIQRLLQAKEEAMKKTEAWQAYVGDTGEGDQDKWYKYTHPDDEDGSGNSGIFSGITNSMKFWMDKQAYAFKNNIKQWMSSVLEVVFQAASLCINTMRTFILIVLAILGPLVFGLSVFDGFQNTLTQWMARYINVFLWLPVANIFGAIIGKVQEQMLTLDISQVNEAGNTFFSSTDTAYIIFLIIGIAGYFCVPSVAGYIVHATGSSTIVQKINTMVVQGSTSAANTTYAAGSAIYSKVHELLKPNNDNQPPQQPGSRYQQERLSGK